MPEIEILSPGPRTMVQDTGFRGGRAQGVPRGGVLDRDSLFLLNALLGNPEGTEALELALVAPALRVRGGKVRVATGGNLQGRVTRESDEEVLRLLRPWTATTLAEGEVLRLDPPLGGGTALLGIAGGIEVPRVLESRSTFLKAGFGGLEGRVLRKGDRLRVGSPGPAAGAEDLTFAAPPAPASGPIRVVPGPQDAHFTQAAHACLQGADYTVTPMTDRMGMRLEGPALEHRPECGADIISDGIAPGAIQVPGNGQPIVLLSDAQTTGGYAKIATVISADLSRLGRMVPGDRLRFAAVTRDEAEAIARTHRESLARIAAQTVAVGPALPEGRLDLRTLYEANLISGIIDVSRTDHFPGHLETPSPQEG
ncbi:hypothetical protein BV394_12770 [Brevirhabdus pacifica]|uniref:Uncharacterized protein n=1 Tax=Brevirhabdus pacifica TaxID=1267768 RepID=A0A1U7DMF0_9RHOB|nr:biotin-dependent carboxyltransferase family protein [Brevirhabdus pacifica]APX91151.1 hypothetical protein BV394_12770 [Brevirhabdus pacifica]OWU78847.1 hypothetical protein ATO5_06695 [Loktanella sp. 22II-4b]PJJ85401.1 allophanate hydrolase [Brevirhabdus pacifica]